MKESRQIWSDLAPMISEHEKKMEDIKQAGIRDDRVTKWQVLLSMAVITLTLGPNEWIKVGYTQYWIDNVWICIIAIIGCCVGLVISFWLPEKLISKHNTSKRKESDENLLR